VLAQVCKVLAPSGTRNGALIRFAFRHLNLIRFELPAWFRGGVVAEGAIMVTANSSVDFVIFLGSAIFAP